MPCTCTVWADGYLPITHDLPDLVRSQRIEFELERGALPVLSGRVHDGERSVAGAQLSIARLLSTTWRQDQSPVLAMAKTGPDGEFGVAAPGGRYVMTVSSGGTSERRVVDLPLVAPIDIDVAVDTAIVAEVRDSADGVCDGYPIELHGSDGRVVHGETDARGVVRFDRLPTGDHMIELKNMKRSRHPTPDQQIPVGVRTGEERHVAITIPSQAPRFARLIVDGLDSFAGWRACAHYGLDRDNWTSVEPSGRIPIDICGLGYLRISGPETREWDALLPKDAPDGYAIRLTLEGVGYEGVVAAQTTGEPLANLRVIARGVNASQDTAIVVTAVTDVRGHFRLIGLGDDDYSMRFEDTPRTGDYELISVHPTVRPAIPPAQLTIELPKNLKRFSSQTPSAFEGFPPIRVAGVVRSHSGPLPEISGHVGSIFPRAGYRLTLFTPFAVARDGSFELRAPAAPVFAASMWLHTVPTGSRYEWIEWDANCGKEGELHDIELP